MILFRHHSPAGETLARRAALLRRHDCFDLIRIGLAVGIVCFHSFPITYGDADAIGPALQAAAKLILPAFFGLSGFLVMGSLERAPGLAAFLMLRLLRLLPGLVVVTAFSALLLGPLLGTMTLADYVGDPRFATYLRNMLGDTQYYLPGLFGGNPRPGVVNGSLWTIHVELLCYFGLALLALLGLTNRWWMAAIACVLGIALATAQPIPAWLPAPDLVLAFCCGAALFRFSERIPAKPCVAAFCLVCAYALAWDGREIALTGVPLTYGVIWLGLRRRPVRLPGDWSYGLYLFSYPLGQSFVRLFPGLHLWWATLACDLAVGLFLAALLWRFVEQPVLRRRHKLSAAIASAAAERAGRRRRSALRKQPQRGLVPVRLEEQLPSRRI